MKIFPTASAATEARPVAKLPAEASLLLLGGCGVDAAGRVAPPDYDPGLLSDFGGGEVGWWQDYLRAEIGRANEYWREILQDNL